MRTGIMQGRLVPPVDGRIQCFPVNSWQNEFSFATQVGLSSIEWIYEVYGAEENPIATDAGVATMKALSNQHNVDVLSLCADWFMDKPLLRVRGAELEERIAKLLWLLERCRVASINRIVIPFVDVSRIQVDQEHDELVAILKNVVPFAEKTGVEVHLETDLPPTKFATLLGRLPSHAIKANYDSGNSSSLGYLPTDEFQAYGDRVGSVHIKDRVKGGSTVPLGTGDADFNSLFRCLRDVGYNRDFILQVARGEPGGEVEWAKKNRAFAEKHFKKAGLE